jgi:Predicted membrane protein (DUF2232)
MDRNPSPNGATLSRFFRVAPFFLPFLFSILPPLSIISPIPLFILTLRNELRISLIALIGNLLLVSLIYEPFLIWVVGLYWFSIGVFFPTLIRKTGRIQLSAVLSYFFQIAAIVLGVAVLAKKAHLGIEDFVRRQISLEMDLVIKEAQGPIKDLVEVEGREGLFKLLMSRFPAGVLIAMLLSFWINLLFISQILKGFLSKTFWTRFRTPDWLVWPALACGALYLFTEHAPYLIGLNGFQLFVTIYALQGFSILSFFLHRIGIHEFFRFILYAIAFFFALSGRRTRLFRPLV